MNNSILEFKDVGISFDNNKTFVLKDVNFSVFKGEILSIIGLNGTGKTTLLKIIAGIYKNYFGEIIKNYKKISYVPQKINLDKTFPIKVYEFIRLYNGNVSSNLIKLFLEKFNSVDLFDRNINTLSGGEFQKVMIISALISKPDLILFDEPTSGIDVLGEEFFYELVSDVKNLFPYISIILVSHNLNLVYKNSDKVLCLHKDNFCCHGTPSEIIDNLDARNIIGNYLLPYKHNPHKKCIH
ncbi:MAG: metal ABC transporter ATP-binding protein [Candidatus Gracilibacteria bacterium]|nr:metal ABC transporter ATP-binding protein [Candidatus Gracilibacteria bacterium]